MTPLLFCLLLFSDLHTAARGGDIETVSALLAHGADVNEYDSLGGTTLVADPTHPGAMIEKGRLGIRNVIDSTIFVIAADSRINGHFTVLLSEVTKGDLSGFTDLSENLTTFVAGATGAKNFIYIGLSMHDAHDPAVNNRMNGKATSADFDAFVSDLATGAGKNKLPSNLLTSVAKIVESLRSQVVQM